MNKKALWLRLCRYHFDHLVPTGMWNAVRARFGGANASTRAFADKLARKLGWSHNFSLRALYEYKKFVFLGITSEFVVTPSKIIDQVWHEHLLFTKAYRSFCNDIIKYPFDHEPELAPFEDQKEQFALQFASTFDAYRKEFGQEPPCDIWSDPKFDPETIRAAGQPRKKRERATAASDSGSSGAGDEASLASSGFMYADEGPLSETMDSSSFDFGDGDGGGGGASGSWADGNSIGDGISDSSGSDSSCSSCSSGCGGGD